MLAIATIIAIVGLALLTYFWPAAIKQPDFHFARHALGVALIGYALSEGCMKMVVANRGLDMVRGATFGLVVGWIALLIGLKGIFALLAARGRAALADDR